MKGMISRFRQFISSNQLLTDGSKTILAVSGGLDSVVMAHLFARAEYPFAIAHCNFNLRGAESDGDELFVRELAAELGVPFYHTSFQTEAFAQEKGLSIQMAARELRYQWFAELLQQQGYDFLATAHHKDDVAETVLLNLVKGAILTGLQGILPKKEKLIRPLLWAEKQELHAYAADNGIQYREDSSNQENKYQRNMLRNQVIPLLRKINPNVTDTIYEATVLRKEIIDWTAVKVKELWTQIGVPIEDGIAIDIPLLEKSDFNATTLAVALEDYGFTYSQVQNLFRSLPIPDAKTFTSATHRMVKERSRIIIMPVPTESRQSGEISVHADMQELSFEGVRLKMDLVPASTWVMERRPQLAQLDFDKLKFPLHIRNWKPGDAFIPLGMKGKKKVSDFLTDIHAEMLHKEEQLVLISGDDIVWLVGQRIDERYKVTPTTRNVYRLEIE